MKQEQQQQAQRLYFQTDLSKTQIAEMLNISRRSLHYWIRENHWERLKKSAAAMPSLITENCYYIMAHYTEQLLSADRMDKPLTREEVDNLHKLAITINKVKSRSTLNESMEMFTGFLESVNERSPQLMPEVQPLINDYIVSQASISPKSVMPAKFNSMGYMPTPTEQDPTEAQLDLEDTLAWAQQAQSTQSLKRTDEGNITLHSTSPAPLHSTSPAPLHSTSPSPLHSTSPSPLYSTSPSPLERAGVRPSIREQLRGTATTGPGKSYHKNRPHAAV